MGRILGGGGAVDLGVTLGRVELPSPVLTASGTFGHGDEVAKLGDPARLGAITAKSLCPEPWAGKPAPRLHMTAAGMLNAVGLQGPGVAAWLAHDLPALRATGARVIASVWGQTVEEFALAAELLEPARDDLVALEVNVSCPNLHARSEMFAHDPDATRAVIAAVVGATTLPVFAKLSPNVTDLTWASWSTPRPAVPCSEGEGAACPVPRSNRSRCARCTTCRARSRTSR